MTSTTVASTPRPSKTKRGAQHLPYLRARHVCKNFRSSGWLGVCRYAIVTLPLAVLQASIPANDQALAAAPTLTPAAADHPTTGASGQVVNDDMAAVKLAAVTFSPALSARKCDAIQKMGVRHCQRISHLAMPPPVVRKGVAV